MYQQEYNGKYVGIWENTGSAVRNGGRSYCYTIPAMQFIPSFCLLYSSCTYICEWKL